MAHGIAFVALALVVLGVGAAPAGAHSTAGLPATDWRSRVVAVRVAGAADPSIRARTSDSGQHLELTTNPNESVTVLGYRGEPYLWFTHGRVLENVRSPAAWLNKRTNASDPVPRGYSATAPPLWRTVASGSTYRWHDHRVHATSHDKHSHGWTIPIVVDERDGAIVGRLDLVAGPSLALPLLAIALGAAAVVVIARRNRAVMAVLAIAVAVGAAAQVAGTWHATTATVLQRIGPSLYAVAAVVAALLIARAARSRARHRYESMLLVGGVVICVTGGLAHIDWLTHSQLPTALDAAVARALLVAQLFTGLGATIAGVLLLESAGPTSGAAKPARTPEPQPV